MLMLKIYENKLSCNSMFYASANYAHHIQNIVGLQGGHSLTWAQQRILFTQILKVVESNFDQGCLTELAFIFLYINQTKPIHSFEI
jgi:hypothetical protein